MQRRLSISATIYSAYASTTDAMNLGLDRGVYEELSDSIDVVIHVSSPCTCDVWSLPAVVLVGMLILGRMASALREQPQLFRKQYQGWVGGSTLPATKG